jgi:serine palmitoyltransferase
MSPSPYRLKKRYPLSPASIASTSPYLFALSKANTRARSNENDHARSPISTSAPSLSSSSSVSSDSEDTVLNEDEDDNADGLALPKCPPSSEQVFTVHTEFGYCANEQYRLISQHTHGTPLLEQVEQDPPYYVLFCTYINYLTLLDLGHVRDFVGKRLNPAAYKRFMPFNVCFLLSYVIHQLTIPRATHR